VEACLYYVASTEDYFDASHFEDHSQQIAPSNHVHFLFFFMDKAYNINSYDLISDYFLGVVMKFPFSKFVFKNCTPPKSTTVTKGLTHEEHHGQ